LTGTPDKKGSLFSSYKKTSPAVLLALGEGVTMSYQRMFYQLDERARGEIS